MTVNTSGSKTSYSGKPAAALHGKGSGNQGLRFQWGARAGVRLVGGREISTKPIALPSTFGCQVRANNPRSRFAVWQGKFTGRSELV